MVEEGLIDVVQHDFRMSSLTWWRSMAAHLEQWDVLCAPTRGEAILSDITTLLRGFHSQLCTLEAAPAHMPGFIEDGWSFIDGKLIVPDTPGAGIAIEEKIFAQGVADRDGFSLQL